MYFLNYKTQLFCCAFLTGLIWVIQIVHYPSFRFIDKRLFKSFAGFHSQYITFIVGILMPIEMISAVVLMLRDDHIVFKINLAGIGLIWASTAFLSIPCHSSLQEGFSLEKVDRLIFTNWPRTLLWTLRSVLLLASFEFC